MSSELDTPLTEEEKAAHREDERIIREFLFEFRQVMAALLRIKDRRSYRPAYTSFDAYVRCAWPDIFGDISRSYLHRQIEHERTVQAIEAENSRRMVGNVANSQQIPIPTKPHQTDALHTMPIEDRVAGWELTAELNDGEVPTGAQVTETIAVLKSADSPKQPAPQQSLIPYKKSFSYIDPFSVMTSPESRQVFVTYVRPAFRNRRTNEEIKENRVKDLPIPFRIFEEQGWTPPPCADEEEVKPTNQDGPSDDVIAYVQKERDRIAAIQKPADLFSDDAQPDPEETPAQGSFIAGIDFSDIDQLTEGAFGDYPQ